MPSLALPTFCRCSLHSTAHTTCPSPTCRNTADHLPGFSTDRDGAANASQADAFNALRFST